MFRDSSLVVYLDLTNPKDQIPRSTSLGFPKYVLQDAQLQGWQTVDGRFQLAWLA